MFVFIIVKKTVYICCQEEPLIYYLGHYFFHQMSSSRPIWILKFEIFQHVFEGFEVFIPLEFYNRNCIGRVRNS